MANKHTNNIESRVLNLESTVEKLCSDISILKNSDLKAIENSYILNILSKISILKNMLEIEPTEDFFNPSLLIVESIERQIKETKKISNKQFDQLNDIYRKQKLKS